MPTLSVVPSAELGLNPDCTSFLYDVKDKFPFVTVGLGFTVPTAPCNTVMAANAVRLAETKLVEWCEKWEMELCPEHFQRRLVEVMAVVKEIERLTSDWLMGEDSGIVASVSGPDGTIRDYYVRFSYGIYLANDNNRYRNTHEFGDYVLVSRHTGCSSKEPIETVCGYYPSKVSALIGLVRKMAGSKCVLQLKKDKNPAGTYVTRRYIDLVLAMNSRQKEEKRKNSGVS